MLRSLKRVSPLISISIISRPFEYDVDTLNKPPPQAPKTGWERVKRMYIRREDEDVSLELKHVAQSAMAGAFMGVCIGGFVGSKKAYLDFIENNQASIFKSTFDAKKKLQDYVTVSFAKYAVRWGWRLAIFTGIFSLTSTTLSVYRNDTSLIDYISAGAIAGGAYKMHLGMAATCVGSGLGAVLGAIFGSLIILILKVTGVKIEDLRKALTALDEERKQQMHEAMEKSAKIKHDQLTDHHDALVAEKGEKKLNEIL